MASGTKSGETGGGRTERLRHALEHAAHLLPAQGPIGVFIHHNTLHAFQHLPFEQAVVEAGEVFGAKPFLTEAQYRAEIDRGRILARDIDEVIDEEPDVAIWPRTLSQKRLRRTLLQYGLRRFSAENIEWQIEEEGLLDRLRDDLDPSARESILGETASGEEAERQATRELFAACYRRLPLPELPPAKRPERPRDAILAAGGGEIDIDDEINALMTRLCAVFLDQGQAYWPMPQRREGFYRAVRALFGTRGMFALMPDRHHLRGLKQSFQRQTDARMTAEEAVLASLGGLGVGETEWEEFLTAELLALPGWAGLISQLEANPALAPHEPLPASLLDYLAVRLTLVETAAANAWRSIGRTDPLASGWRSVPVPAADSSLVSEASEAGHMAAVARLFDAAQLLGLSAGEISSLSGTEFQRLTAELEKFDDRERRRLLHLAYERRHEKLNLAPINLHRQGIDPSRGAERRRAQVFFCIDEREESMRRALEECAPEVETLGAAGFFGVAVNYRGLDDAHGVALCPVVVTPRHEVIEKPAEEESHLHAKRQRRRRLWADLTHASFIGSRTLIRGWLGTTGLGLVSLFPLVTRVLAPRRAGQIYRWLGERFLPDPRTELTLMRPETLDGASLTDQLLPGFTITEKAERVASVLRPAGLVNNHSRMVVILGHGSTSLNNPHESAHDCGACGGRRGGPNARLFAAMANHPGVRARLREMGIDIPADTWFLGGYHDTCNDDVIFFDEGLVPASHVEELKFVRTVLDAARAANALERSRRFEAAWADKSPESALRHVQERADHLAEPRPEYGHATNAVAIVGRRSLTTGLFLDRRSFLISYDPTIDDEGRSLAALLGAAGPVCAGINLEYYFSFVDNERYGCGTKLPHNVTGLIGVMNGHASDLRTGLPWQMVEVHEPVRLLLIVENTPEKTLSAAFASPVVRELIENRWIRLATIDPLDGTIHVYRAGNGRTEGRFEPFTEVAEELPEVANSPAWYLGKLEHLPIARVRGAQR